MAATVRVAAALFSSTKLSGAATLGMAVGLAAAGTMTANAAAPGLAEAITMSAAGLMTARPTTGLNEPIAVTAAATQAFTGLAAALNEPVSLSAGVTLFTQAAAASLAEPVTIGATGVDNVSGASSLAEPIALAAGPSQTFNSAASLLEPIHMTSGGTMTANASTPGLTEPVTLSASTGAVIAAAAGLTEPITLAAAAVATLIGASGLSEPFSMTVSGLMVANAVAALAEPITLAGGATRITSAVAGLLEPVTLSASGTFVAVSSGGLTEPFAISAKVGSASVRVGSVLFSTGTFLGAAALQLPFALTSGGGVAKSGAVNLAEPFRLTTLGNTALIRVAEVRFSSGHYSLVSQLAMPVSLTVGASGGGSPAAKVRVAGIQFFVPQLAASLALPFRLGASLVNNGVAQSLLKEPLTLRSAFIVPSVAVTRAASFNFLAISAIKYWDGKAWVQEVAFSTMAMPIALGAAATKTTGSFASSSLSEPFHLTSVQGQFGLVGLAEPIACGPLAQVVAGLTSNGFLNTPFAVGDLAVLTQATASSLADLFALGGAAVLELNPLTSLMSEPLSLQLVGVVLQGGMFDAQFSYWDGTGERSIYLQGYWDGAEIQPFELTGLT